MARLSDPFAPLGSNILGNGAEMADYCVFTITSEADDLWADASHTARLANILYDSRAGQPTSGHFLIADGLTDLLNKQNYQILGGVNRAESVSGVWHFRPDSGTVPFTVGNDRTGTVTNLSAEMLDGRKRNTKLSGTEAPDANSVATHDASGRLPVADPTEDYHAVNRRWVLINGQVQAYLHTQSVPAVDWVVAHGFGANPVSISVMDASGRLVSASAFASLSNPLNETVVRHSAAMTGTVLVLGMKPS